MTVWMPFPCELERCFYEVELRGGQRLRRIWPLKREGQPDTFYSSNAGIVTDWVIVRVRVFDESNKD